MSSATRPATPSDLTPVETLCLRPSPLPQIDHAEGLPPHATLLAPRFELRNHRDAVLSVHPTEEAARGAADDRWGTCMRHMDGTVEGTIEVEPFETDEVARFDEADGEGRSHLGSVFEIGGAT